MIYGLAAKALYRAMDYPVAVNIIKLENYSKVMPEGPKQQDRGAIDRELAAEIVKDLHAPLDEFALIAAALQAK